MSTVAVVLVCVVLGALAVFQALLVAGAPLGQFAWGGRSRVLPAGLRVGSAVAIAVYTVVATVVLRRAGVVSGGIPPTSPGPRRGSPRATSCWASGSTWPHAAGPSGC